jgi:hypothetical protein
VILLLLLYWHCIIASSDISISKVLKRCENSDTVIYAVYLFVYPL